MTYHESMGPVAVMRSEEISGDVYAFEPESGSVQWDYTDEDVGGGQGAPADTTDDYVVGREAVAVLDPADGSEVTKFGGSDGVDIGVPSELGYGPSELFVVDSFNRTITGYDLETGEQRWQVPEFEVNHGPVLRVKFFVVDGTLVGVDGESVFGVDRQAEDVTLRIDGNPQGAISSDTRVFLSGASGSMSLIHAVDVTGGAIDWETEMSVGAAMDFAGDRLLVESKVGVTVFDATSGDVLQEPFDPSRQFDAESAQL